MSRKTVITSSNPPEPFADVDTVEESRSAAQIRSAISQFQAEYGVDPETYADRLQAAYAAVQAGALIETAIHAHTGLSRSVWRELSPELDALFEQALCAAATSREIQLGQDKPLEWLRQARPESWTPKERHEHDLTQFSTETLLQALATSPGDSQQ